MQIDTRGTAKAEVLEGDPKCPNLIEASVYYTKPVHYIVMVSEELKCTAKEKECLNVNKGKIKI